MKKFKYPMNQSSLNHFYQRKQGSNPRNSLKHNYAGYAKQHLEEKNLINVCLNYLHKSFLD